MVSSSRKLSEVFEIKSEPWRYRNEYLLEHLIRVQAGAARRNITPVHFWRFRKELSGSTPVFRETGANKGVYDPPIAALLNVNHTPPKKELTKAMVDEKVDTTVTIDLAECIRLGEQYDVEDPGLSFKFYLPGPKDVYQWNFSLYEIEETHAQIFYEALGRFVVWEMQAKLKRGDSAHPDAFVIQKSDPPLEQPLWAK